MHRPCTLLIAASLIAVPTQASAAPSQAAIASAIKADVAEIVAGINAKDIYKATKFDAPDLVSMESGREPSVGAKADHDGLSMSFKYNPNWHLTLIDETVDVAKSGDLATYRGTYAEDMPASSSVARGAVVQGRQRAGRDRGIAFDEGFGFSHRGEAVSGGFAAVVGEDRDERQRGTTNVNHAARSRAHVSAFIAPGLLVTHRRHQPFLARLCVRRRRADRSESAGPGRPCRPRQKRR